MKNKFAQKRMELEGDTRMLIFLQNKLGENVEEELTDVESAMILLGSIEEEEVPCEN